MRISRNDPRSAISRVVAVVVVIVILIIAGVGLYAYSSLSSTSQSTTTSTSTTTTTTPTTTSQTSVASSTSPSTTLSTTTTTSSSLQLTSVKMGVIVAINSLPQYVAQQEGFFQKNGLDVTLVSFPRITNALTALQAGDIQFTFDVAGTELAQASAGTYLKIVSPMDATGTVNGTTYSTAFAVARGNITTIQQLAGKTIATTSSAGGQYQQAQVLFAKAGVNTSQIKWVFIPSSTMIAALEQNQVDCVLATEPFATQIINTVPNTHRVFDTTAGVINSTVVPTGNVAATAQYVSANPNVAHAVALSIAEANAWLTDNPTAAQALAVNLTGLNASLITQLWDNHYIPAFIPYPNGWTDWKPLQELANVLYSYGFLKNQVNATELVQVPWYTPQ